MNKLISVRAVLSHLLWFSTGVNVVRRHFSNSAFQRQSHSRVRAIAPSSAWSAFFAFGYDWKFMLLFCDSLSLWIGIFW